MNKAIVLVSGGMDSLVTAAIANEENDELYFLHVNYGQLTEKRELQSFRDMVKFYQPDGKLITDIKYLTQIGGSSLTDANFEVSKTGHKAGIPNTYVPFRNAHLICIAVSWAEVIGANRIYIGAVEEDSSGYPDCRESFFESFSKTIHLGTKPDTQIEICTPVIHKRKSEIVAIGNILQAPFTASWSCYTSNEEACGVCDSCRLRIKAFQEAGVKDPIPYAIAIDWNK